MYKILATCLMMSMASCTITEVSAQTQTVYGTVTRVDPVYVQVPSGYYDTRCQEVYVERGGSSGDVLAGMIAGGIIGRAIGGDDRSARAGAVLGGLAAADNGRGRVEVRCHEVYVNQQRLDISHYSVEYTLNGKYYIFETPQYYTPGSTIIIHQ